MEWSGKVSEERTFDLSENGIRRNQPHEVRESLLSRGNACAKGPKREQVGFFKRKEANNMSQVCPEGRGSSGDEVSEVGKLDEAGPWGLW